MWFWRFVCLGFIAYATLFLEAEEPAFNKEILAYVKTNLEMRGTLCQNAEGFVYVKVDDEYIHKLVQFLAGQGFEEPPYFGRAELVGAHISVIYTQELQQKPLENIVELGQSIVFEPIECKVVQPPTWPEVEAVYLIAITAPELAKIRQKYGLPESKYAFHITIGIKRAAAKAA